MEPEGRTQPTLSRITSGRRSNDSNSPEFEFWMVRNPSFPHPHLLSADELFVNGVLLPLQVLPQHPNPSDSDHLNPIVETTDPGPESSSSTQLSTSKRWKHIFKLGEKKTATKDKEKKKERKSSNSGASSSAELNINLWPFARSRSAGNNRPKMVSGGVTRKVSSAPCSRSNSAGESKSKKWPSSPARGGVHLGRSSPVWQVRRGGSCVRSSEPVVRNMERGVKKDCLESQPSKSGQRSKSGGGGARVRVLNLSIPMCIGYDHSLSCRSDGGGSGNGGNEGIGGNIFNLRTLFSKKVF